MRLSEADYEALLSTVEGIYGIRYASRFPAGLLHAIEEVIPCDLITYNQVDSDRSRISSVSEPAGVTSSPEVQQTLTRYLKEHPLVDYYVRTGDGKSIKISDFLTQRQFHNLGLYCEFYRKHGIEHQMTTSIITGPRQLIGIALSRSSTDFFDKDRLMLDLLRPHLLQAYRNAQAIDILRTTPEILANSGLTPRESEILCLVFEGKTNAEISQALSISLLTVKKHLEHIYRKLRVHTRGAAVAHLLHAK